MKRVRWRLILNTASVKKSNSSYQTCFHTIKESFHAVTVSDGLCDLDIVIGGQTELFNR